MQLSKSTFERLYANCNYGNNKIHWHVTATSSKERQAGRECKNECLPGKRSSWKEDMTNNMQTNVSWGRLNRGGVLPVTKGAEEAGQKGGQEGASPAVKYNSQVLQHFKWRWAHFWNESFNIFIICDTFLSLNITLLAMKHIMSPLYLVMTKTWLLCI